MARWTRRSAFLALFRKAPPRPYYSWFKTHCRTPARKKGLHSRTGGDGGLHASHDAPDRGRHPEGTTRFGAGAQFTSGHKLVRSYDGREGMIVQRPSAGMTLSVRRGLDSGYGNSNVFIFPRTDNVRPCGRARGSIYWSPGAAPRINRAASGTRCQARGARQLGGGHQRSSGRPRSRPRQLHLVVQLRPRAPPRRFTPERRRARDARFLYRPKAGSGRRYAIKWPGMAMLSPPMTGPTGTNGGAKVGMGPLPSTSEIIWEGNQIRNAIERTVAMASCSA